LQDSDRSHLVVTLVEKCSKLKKQDWEVVEKDLFDFGDRNIDGLRVVVDALNQLKARKKLPSKKYRTQFIS